MIDIYKVELQRKQLRESFAVLMPTGGGGGDGTAQATPLPPK
jgi:hypothetical protein